ncbi:MAG: oligosaccharide flippase family protein [Armatimonadetes bacterium]|nr:oligosaccharide flippase family protein [Armatimonadota bacterium]
MPVPTSSSDTRPASDAPETEVEEPAPPSGSASETSHKSLSSAVFLVGQPLFLNALSIPATAYIIRVLGEYGYGYWAAATALVAATSSLAMFGFRPLFVRAVAQEPERAEIALGEQLGLRGLLAFIAGTLAVLIAAGLGYNPVILGCVAIASLTLLFTIASSVLGDLLQGFQRFKAFAVVNLIAGILLTLASVVAVQLGYGPIGLAAAYMVGPAVSFGCFYTLVWRHYFRPTIRWDPGRYRLLLREARMLGAQTILMAVQSRIEQLVVPKLVGIAAMGYFTAGLIIPSRLEMVPDGLSTAFYPIIAGSAGKDRERMARQVGYLMLISLVVSVPLVLLALYIAPFLATFFFKENAEACLKVMWITVWTVPLQAVFYPMNYSLQACGLHSESARRGMISILFGTALSLALIAGFGLMGACASWVARQGIAIAFLLPVFIKAFPTVFPRLPLFRILIGGGTMAALLWGTLLLRLSVPVTIMLGILLAPVAYTGALVLLRVIDPAELRQMFKKG